MSLLATLSKTSHTYCLPPAFRRLRQERCYDFEATDHILTIYKRDVYLCVCATFFPRGLVLGNSSRVLLSGILLPAQECGKETL